MLLVGLFRRAMVTVMTVTTVMTGGNRQAVGAAPQRLQPLARGLRAEPGSARAANRREDCEDLVQIYLATNLI